jgi:hypothetical protein
MQEPEFWLRLADRVTGVLRASGDNQLRFLWVDAFDTGTGNVAVDLERRAVTARAWVYGGKITSYLAKLHLSPAAVEYWRNGQGAELLPAENATDWLSISTGDGQMKIRLGGPRGGEGLD